MSDIKVYKMNDYEWWASKLSIEDTEAFYEKEIGEVNDLEDIEECDIDKEGMWWELEDGDSKWVTFREAIKLSREYIEPFCIASTEW